MAKAQGERSLTFEVRDHRFRRIHQVAQGLGLITVAAQHYEDACAEAKEQLVVGGHVS